MSAGIQSAAVGVSLARAAEAMIRMVGGGEVTILFPRATAPDDPGIQLGLVAPTVDQVTLFPAAVRSLTAESSTGRVRVEFLLPASAVADQVESQQANSAKAFFDAALGISHEGRLLRIVKAEADYFGGQAYLWRVTAEE